VRRWLVLVGFLWLAGLVSSLYLTPHHYVVAGLFGAAMLLASYLASPVAVAVVAGISVVLEVAVALIDQVPVQAWAYSVLALVLTGLLSVTVARERFRAATRAKEAERARQQLQQFTEAISQGMRDPLFVVLARTHLVAADTPGHRDNLRAIDDAVETLRSFSDDIIDAAHIGAGQFHLEPSPFDAAEMAKQVVQRFQSRAGERSIELAADAPLGVWWDKRRAEQLLSKLIDNALRHSSRSGQVRIGISKNNGRVHIAVNDDGPTIAGDQLAQTFEPFSVLYPAQPRGEQDAGVDLYICQAIAEAHGGSIRVEATNGHGTTFHVDMPQS